MLGVLALGWVLWTLFSASHALEQSADRAEVMRAALQRGDAQGARAALRQFQDATQTAEGRTSGVTWSVFEAVPVVGDDADGVALAASVLADLGRDGLPPVAEAADKVSADAFQPTGHRFPVAKIAAMQDPARQSEAAFDKAAQRLAPVEAERFVGPVHRQFDRLRDLVDNARSTLGSTYRAARLMPRMLGQDEPSYYLMVLQNNAEIRSSGGLPGALSLVRASNGKVKIVEQTDMSDIGEETADLRLELSAEEEHLFGRRLGDIAVDATLTPDFARAAALIRARWERAVDRPLDGIIFVDPVAVSYLLAGTGPVPVPGYAPVHQGNVVRAVENEVYLRTLDRHVQSAYQQAVAKAVFDAFANGRGDTVASIRGLVSGVMEGRVRMHFFGRPDQAEIAGTRIAGEFPSTPGPQPRVGVYVNDAGPSKMQYYLRYDASLFARSCQSGRQQLAGSVEFVNATPPGVEIPPGVTGLGFPGSRLTKSGQQVLVAYVTSPVGGRITSVSIDGQRVRNIVLQQLDGRSVAPVGVFLDPGQRQLVEFEMESGSRQAGDPQLEVSPGAFPGSSNASVLSACTTR